MAIIVRPFDFIASNIWTLNFSILSVPDEGYCSNASYALNLIPMFLCITQQNKHLANRTFDGSIPKSAYMVDWLIVGRCTFSGQYFMHIQDENKFNKIVCISFLNFVEIKSSVAAMIRLFRYLSFIAWKGVAFSKPCIHQGHAHALDIINWLSYTPSSYM